MREPGTDRHHGCRTLGFHLARPYAPLSQDSEFLLSMVGLLTGLAVTGASMWLNWRFLFWRAPGFAMFNVFVSCLSFWIVGMWMLTWANLSLDSRPSKRVRAVVSECVYNSQRLRTGGYTAVKFRGLKVASSDAGIAPGAFIKSSVLRADQQCPDEGTVVTMNLHPGRLGVPWVDDLAWSNLPTHP